MKFLTFFALIVSLVCLLVHADDVNIDTHKKMPSPTKTVPAPAPTEAPAPPPEAPAPGPNGGVSDDADVDYYKRSYYRPRYARSYKGGRSNYGRRCRADTSSIEDGEAASIAADGPLARLFFRDAILSNLRHRHDTLLMSYQ
ncbi:hypothetical protein SeLEV6574_g05435 [Synchytrium endobioticum]|uniref:Uncharacterized protein n=1 Tax=Synchytrium endobioticum TaxID=286115 RepID=A0A507CU95_9FUNG|nr:hypothetical protein SeLEV6574_g05435 [Synchytrium endobioticum]